jgi:predicted branched-subunit amino acid permease
MLGLISTPILGWTLGTLLGGLICSALPEALSAAMGIALYSMFIAILVPPAKASRPVLYIILVSVATTLVLRYLPLFSFISSGFRVIIATIVGAAFGAYFYPVSKEESHA